MSPGRDVPLATSAVITPADRRRLRHPFAESFVHFVTILLCTLHGWGIWLGMEGWAGLTNGWPLWKHDHPLYFYSALASKYFFALNGTNAGYDPGFMAGFAKSAVFPASSNLPELVVGVFGRTHPDVAYKVYVLASTCLVPWLIYASAAIWKAGAFGQLTAVFLYLIYLWTDFPLSYPIFGMVPYFLAIPLGLLVTGLFARYCERGGLFLWLGSSLLFVLVVLIHFTSAMVVAPAALASYLASWKKDGPVFSRSRHFGVWSIPILVIGLNSFWWLPGVLLASTKGASDFAFVHPEGVLVRLTQVLTVAPRIEFILWMSGIFGLVLLFKRCPVMAGSLTVFVVSGFFWGYLAGGLRELDFLQPGRHTYAFYSGLCIAAGVVLERGTCWLRARTGWRWDVGLALGLILVGGWTFRETFVRLATRGAQGKAAFLASWPSKNLLWVYSRVKKNVARGERLLYEESGFNPKGLTDPYDGGRFSGLIPPLLGIEVIGGPYLHAALTTNYTQFGEGKLFGKANWDRAWFVRHARIYRPNAILCWSPRARAFCRLNPDLIEIRDDNGELMIGRVRGFEGFASEGKAEVRAATGRLEVIRSEGGVDGTVVLRYHSVPYLRTKPPVALDSVFLEADPVPFIRFRPAPGPFTIELGFSPGRSFKEEVPRD